MNKTQYKNYLTSPHWKRVRAAWRSQERNNCCWICGSDSDLQVHHRRYERSGESVLFQEKDIHLSTLCDECHGMWHKYFSIHRKFKRSIVAKICTFIEMYGDKEKGFEMASKPDVVKRNLDQIEAWKKRNWTDLTKKFNRRVRPSLD